VIKTLIKGMTEFLEKNEHRGWHSIEDFRGIRRNRIVAHSQIRRPDSSEYRGGYDAEGYAEPTDLPVISSTK